MKVRLFDGEDRVNPLFAAWIDLRQRVLRTPLGLTFSEEDLVAEHGDRHLLALEGAAVIGGLLVQQRDQAPGVWKIRQVAVEPSWQGKGVGRELMLATATLAREAGIKQLVLHSREAVCGFYENLGYVAEGSRFHEVGLPHRKMRLNL